MSYLDSVANAFSEAKAWRTSTFILGILLGGSITGHVYTAVRSPAYIIPHEIAAANGRVKVQPGGNINLDYLQYVAIADLNLALSWKPNNIKQQYARFLNRASPALYAAQNIKLSTDAEKFSKENATQAFYPQDVKLIGKNTVQILGQLVRWTGSQEMFREDYRYTLTYVEAGGMVYVDNLEIANRGS